MPGSLRVVLCAASSCIVPLFLVFDVAAGDAMDTADYQGSCAKAECEHLDTLSDDMDVLAMTQTEIKTVVDWSLLQTDVNLDSVVGLGKEAKSAAGIDQEAKSAAGIDQEAKSATIAMHGNKNQVPVADARKGAASHGTSLLMAVADLMGKNALQREGLSMSALIVVIVSLVLSGIFVAGCLMSSLFTSKPAAERRSRESLHTQDDIAVRAPSSGLIDVDTMAESPSRGRRLARRSTVIMAEVRKKRWTIDMSQETMDGSTFVVNMFADLGPAGFLPVAYGIVDTGYIPTFIILVVFTSFCVYTMWLVSRTALITNHMNYADQWAEVIGPRTRWVPMAVVMMVCFGCNLAYAAFYTDILTGVLPSLGLDMPRWLVCCIFSAFPTLPLCMLKDFSALAPSSSFAVVAVLYTVAVMVVRALDGTYAVGGKYYGDLTPELRPDVPTAHWTAFGLPALSLANSLAVAFLAHYNACKYYRELKGHTPARFATLCSIGMGICAILFGISLVAGFQTFGRHSDAVILKNYSGNDILFTIARLGVGLSLIASYPLMFSGLREALVTMAKIVDPIHEEDFDMVILQDIMTLLMVAMITFCACVLEDTGAVVGIVGALCGSAIIYIIPAVLYLGSLRIGVVDGSHFPISRAFTYFLIGVGLFLMIAGTITTF